MCIESPCIRIKLNACFLISNEMHSIISQMKIYEPDKEVQVMSKAQYIPQP